MSVVSPMLRAKSSVRSKIGRRISSYPYESNTSRAIRSTRRHFSPSPGRMSCTPRTARIVMRTAFPRALASREENGERNGEAGEGARSELVVAGDRRGEPIGALHQLECFDRLRFGVHQPVVPDTVPGVSVQLPHAIAPGRPGRQHLHEKVGSRLHPALGDDVEVVPDYENKVGHDGGPGIQNDVERRDVYFAGA